MDVWRCHICKEKIVLWNEYSKLFKLVIVMKIVHNTVYPKKYAHGFCFAVLCCGYTLTDFPISIRLTSLALWQSNDCPSASKATLMNMDKYFMWIHYELLLNHTKAKHNKPVCIFLGIYCTYWTHVFENWNGMYIAEENFPRISVHLILFLGLSIMNRNLLGYKIGSE